MYNCLDKAWRDLAAWKRDWIIGHAKCCRDDLILYCEHFEATTKAKFREHLNRAVFDRNVSVNCDVQYNAVVRFAGVVVRQNVAL